MTTDLSGASIDRIAQLLGEDRLERDVPLAPLTTFRIGGPARWLFRARDAGELARAVTAGRETGVPTFLLGRGANILIGDRGFPGLVIHNRARAYRTSTPTAAASPPRAAPWSGPT